MRVHRVVVFAAESCLRWMLLLPCIKKLKEWMTGKMTYLIDSWNRNLHMVNHSIVYFTYSFLLQTKRSVAFWCLSANQIKPLSFYSEKVYIFFLKLIFFLSLDCELVNIQYTLLTWSVVEITYYCSCIWMRFLQLA